MDSMREAFTRAIGASQEAESTFAEVSSLLADTRGIGLQHALWLEWDSLRQVNSSFLESCIVLMVACFDLGEKRWRKVVQASRGNAKQIATFLNGEQISTDRTSLVISLQKASKEPS